jgi:phosphomannomutase
LVNETLKKLEKHDGRVNVRASGTESMIRIMVESKNEKETQLASKNLANFAKKLT